MGAVPGLKRRVQIWQFDGGDGDNEGCCLSRSCLPAVNTRVSTYKFMTAAVLAGSWPLPDSRPGPRALEEGEHRQGHTPGAHPPGCSERVFRIPESPRPGRALQALTTSRFSKEVCSLSSFFFSFSLFFSHRDKEKLVKERLPGEGACPAL